jgi:hypothetical protein
VRFFAIQKWKIHEETPLFPDEKWEIPMEIGLEDAIRFANAKPGKKRNMAGNPPRK